MAAHPVLMRRYSEEEGYEYVTDTDGLGAALWRLACLPSSPRRSTGSLADDFPGIIRYSLHNFFHYPHYR